jgi:hypothetical protein
MKTQLISLGLFLSSLVPMPDIAAAAEGAPVPKNENPPAIEFGDSLPPPQKKQTPPAGGYVQRDREAEITLILLSYKGSELATFPVTILAGTKISSISELIPDPQFKSPRRHFTVTRVLRDGSVVAETKRVALKWPEGFQLSFGDIVEVRELF